MCFKWLVKSKWFSFLNIYHFTLSVDLILKLLYLPLYTRFYLELSPLVDQLLPVVQDPRIHVGRDLRLLETNRMKPGDNHNNDVMIIMIILGKPWDNLRLVMIGGVDGEDPIASPRVPSLCLVAQVQLTHFIKKK